jgi:hypothetical protein
MMRSLYILLPLCLSLWCNRLPAQRVIIAGKTDKAKKAFVPPVYLGNSDYSGGLIKKKVFDSLLRQGLKSRDSLGNTYRPIGFDFSYAERNLYEDSAANLVVLTDFSSEYCTGDTLSADISTSTENAQSIYQRTKAGDTAYFDHIKLHILPGNVIFSGRDTLPILGRGMKFVIVK